MLFIPSDKPLLYDLYCCAGGATKGYQRAGFYVVGIDHKPQPHYCGDGFLQMDAIQFLHQFLDGFWPKPATFHASPPCQPFSNTRFLPNVKTENHPDLIEPTRELLMATNLPYVIENVPQAPLINPLMICGTMFGLRVFRHRSFETNPIIWWPPAPCNHWGKTRTKIRFPDGTTASQSFQYADFISVAGDNYIADDGRAAMGIDWMPRKHLSQAIPPAYTEWLGKQIIKELVL